MLFVAKLFDKLPQRPRQPFHPAPPSEKIGGRDGEQQMAFSEILAATVYVNFGVLPFEFWPGYRNADETADGRLQREDILAVVREAYERGQAGLLPVLFGPLTRRPPSRIGFSSDRTAAVDPCGSHRIGEMSHGVAPL
jgi:hypothetical protein